MFRSRNGDLWFGVIWYFDLMMFFFFLLKDADTFARQVFKKLTFVMPSVDGDKLEITFISHISRTFIDFLFLVCCCVYTNTTSFCPDKNNIFLLLLLVRGSGLWFGSDQRLCSNNKVPLKLLCSSLSIFLG